MGMTENEKHYWDLSEVYLAWYSDMQKPILHTGLAMGVLVEMESDLNKHLLKHPKPTEKTNQQINRLNILKSAVGMFSSIAESNYLVKDKLGKLYKKVDELEEKNKELEFKLKNAQDFFDPEMQ